MLHLKASRLMHDDALKRHYILLIRIDKIVLKNTHYYAFIRNTNMYIYI